MAAAATYLYSALLLAATFAPWQTFLCSASELDLNAFNNSALRYHVPAHLLKWTDKLRVQRWLDEARMEFARTSSRMDSDCDDKVGQGYLDRWKAAKEDVCLPGGRSTFSCYPHPSGDLGDDVGSLFCAATNLILDSTDFLGEVVSGAVTRYPTPKKGSARVACALRDPIPWTREQLADQHSDKWLYDALSSTSADEVSNTCNDPHRTVSYPVYFVTRMDTTNAYHHFEHITNFFAALWLYPNKELLRQGITIVAFDGAVPGFYLELWRRIAFPYRIRFLRERPYPPGTCFKNVLLAAMPHRSLYTHAWPGIALTCRSVVFTAVMKWAHALMADARPEWYNWPDGQHRQNGATMVGRVTWISRRHFEAANWDQLTDWQLQRVVDNDDEVQLALSAAVREWNSRSCLRQPGTPDCRQLPVYFEFGAMELGDHRWYPEQLYTLSRTNILVGVHGAGMFNLVWMRPAASAAIEVVQGASDNYHYHNLAHMLGLPYYSVASTQNPKLLAEELIAVMDATAQRMVADQRQRLAAAAAAAARERAWALLSRTVDLLASPSLMAVAAIAVVVWVVAWIRATARRRTMELTGISKV